MLAILDASALFQVEKVSLRKSVLVLIIHLIGKTGLGSSSRHQKRRKMSSNVRELLNIFLLQLIIPGSR